MVLASPIGRILLLLFVLGSPLVDLEAQTVDPGESLSLAGAISLARENNPDYLTQRNQLRSAQWNVRSAYGGLLPSLSASNSFSYTAEGERRLDDVRLSTQPATYSSRYGLSMSLQLNGSSLLAPSVARAQARAVHEQVEGVSAALDSDVTQRYLAVLEARDQVAQAERELGRTDAYVRLAEARLEVQSGTQLDVRRAEVQRGQAEVRLIQARNTAANEVLLLSQIIGRRLPGDVVLPESFELFQPIWRVEELIDLALRENPSLRADRAQVDAAGTRLRATRSSYLPTISFSAGISGFVSEAGISTNDLVSQELLSQQSRYTSCLETNQIRGSAGLPAHPCSAPGDEAAIRAALGSRSRFPFDYSSQPLSASVNVSLPLFNGLNRELQVEEARIARSNAQYQVRAQELRLEVEIESALRNLETAYQSALLQRQVRETAEEELRLAEERFRFGVTTSVEVIDAQASLAEAERAEIAAIYGFHRSIAILEARLGGRLER
jgi:outer membrane protein